MTANFSLRRAEFLLAVSLCLAMLLGACDDRAFTPFEPTSLAFVEQPSNTEQSATIAPAVTVQLRNAEDEPVTSDDVEITLRLNGGDGSAELSGTLTQPTVAGIATFDDLSIDTIGEDYTLSARAIENEDIGSVTSDAFDVRFGPQRRLVFRAEPPDTVSYAPVPSEIIVEIQDQFGNVIGDANDEVTLSLGGNGGALLMRGWNESAEIIDANIPAVVQQVYSDLGFNVAMSFLWESSTNTVLVADSDNPNLWRYDPADGSLVEVSNDTVGYIKGMAASLDDDTVYAVLIDCCGGPFATDALYTLNTETGQLTGVGPVTVSEGTIDAFTGLTVDAVDGTLYASAKMSDITLNGHALLSINPETLEATIVGDLGDRVAGLATDQRGNLYAVTGSGSGATNPNQLRRVNEVTGELGSNLLDLTPANEGQTLASLPGQLVGTLTVEAENGVATFSDLSVRGVGINYSFVASAAGLDDSESDAFDVTPQVDLLAEEISPVVEFATDAQTVSESDGTVTVTINLGSPQDHDVFVAFSGGGTATPGDDFEIPELPGNVLRIPPGNATYDVVITLIDDTEEEPDEELELEILNIGPGALGTTLVHTITITSADLEITLFATMDNTIYEQTFSGSHVSNGFGDWLFAGRSLQGTGFSIRRALMAFDIAGGLPAGIAIQNASLTLYNDRQFDSTPLPMSVHALSAEWGQGSSDAGGNEGGGTSSLPGDASWWASILGTSDWTTPGGDFVSTPSVTIDVGGTGSYTWSSTEMTDDVIAWYSGAADNFGWILLGDESTEATVRRFRSVQNADTVNRPQLTVSYLPTP